MDLIFAYLAGLAVQADVLIGTAPQGLGGQAMVGPLLGAMWSP